MLLQILLTANYGMEVLSKAKKNTRVSAKTTDPNC
jgi:hypothetical protein